jgi:hypothetical protein
MIENLDKYIEKKNHAEKRVKIGGIVAVVGALFFLAPFEAGFVIAFIGIFVGAIIGGIGFSEFTKISKSFKSEVLTGLVDTFVDNGHFDPNQGLSQSQVYSTEFVKRADRFHTEDYLRGSMDGVEFVSSDVKLEERHVEHTKNGTRTYYETYFLGRIFIFEFNKTFDGYLQVLEGGRPTVNRKYKKVKLESVQFNKKFKTYSTSEHSAFYVLTPHLMEALMKFEQTNKGTIKFSFLGTKLFIGINNFRDTFELRMFRKLDNTVFDEFKRDLLVIQDVIHELRLNNKLFKKGV